MSAKNIQMSIKETPFKKPVFIGGVQQNCYLVDTRPVPLLTPRPNATQTKYTEIVEKKLPNGFIEELQEQVYPINSDSVSSYIEASDYRNDPMQAIANAPKRVNLGDITEVQDFVKNNPTQAVTQYADILRKVATYFEQQGKKQETPAPAEKTPAPAEKTPESEVKANG